MNPIMEQTENAAKLMGASSVVAAVSSLAGYITADTVIPTIGAVVAIGMGIAGAAKAFKDQTHKWELDRKDKYIRSLEAQLDREAEEAEKDRTRLEARIDVAHTILRAWKDAAIEKGIRVDEAALIAGIASGQKNAAQ